MVTTESGRMDLDIPRDRQATFDPQLIAKYQRRFPGFDEKIVSMYARGMSVREIVGHLRELYGIEVSPDLVSAVTDAVLEEIAAWQARPLEPVYPLVFFDALRVKVRRAIRARGHFTFFTMSDDCANGLPRQPRGENAGQHRSPSGWCTILRRIRPEASRATVSRNVAADHSL